MPSSSTAGTPRLRSGLNYPLPSQYSHHEWQLLVKLVWQTRKAQAQQGLQTHRSTTYKSLRDALIETQPNLSKRKAKMALLDHQEFLATQAGTDLWTLEPQQLQRLVKGLSRLGEGQLYTDGHRPQQRPLRLPRAQGQHCPPSGLSGRRAAEPPPTRHLSKYRLQLCHQGLTLD